MSSKSSAGSAWKTATPGADPYKPSLVERAKQRSVRAKTDRNYWAVAGKSQLGDSYDSYDVHLLPDGSLHCSCQNSRGGEFRKTCSHRTAVLLWREDHDDPWLGDDGEEDFGLDEHGTLRGSGVTDSSSPEVSGQDMVSGESPERRNPSPVESSAHETPAQEISGGEAEGLRIPSAHNDSPPDQMSEGGDGVSSFSSPDVDDPPSDSSEEGSGERAGPGLVSVTEAQVTPSPSDLFDPWELDWDNPPSPQQITWAERDHPLPDKFEQFRDDQWHGIIEAVEALDDDDVKAVFLSAPTGTGKSLIAATVPQILGQAFIYTCTTHVLQNQVETEFYYADVLKGRRNYPTLDDPSLTADDCTKERTTLPACSACPGWTKTSSWTGKADDESTEEGFHCHNCHPTWQCPYEQAKKKASNSRMAVLNTAYFLSETSTYNSFFKGWPLVIMDEADMLEQELMGHITVEISARTRKDLGVGMPAKVSKEESWVEWLSEEVIPAIKAKLLDLPVSTNDLFGKPDVKVMRARKRYKRLLEDCRMLLKPPPLPRGEERDPDDEDTPALSSGWVMTGYETQKGEDKQEHNQNVIFKPITVRDYAHTYLWDKAHQFILMSATIISPEQMAYDLGLEDHEWVVVEVPSSFPKERRPIVIRGEVAVTNKTIAEAYPVLVRQLGEIMEEHPDERILVHSNSYKLTRELFFETRNISYGHKTRLYAYFNAQERDGALTKYLNDSRGVLIAPSFDRGVDLHGDDCRVIVVAKVPYPYLGDKQIKARLYGTGASGKTWYAVETIRSICQMTGRGMRSKTDAVITYILDNQFTDIYWRNPRLFPKWWSEALVWDENDPKWRDALEMFREGSY